MQTPKRLPGEFSAGRHEGIFGFFGKAGEQGSGIGIVLLGEFFSQLGGQFGSLCVAFEPPAEERPEFFAASSTNSASVR